MQDHRIDGPFDGAPPPASHEHQVQRWVLLTLVSYPPARGDDIDDLARELDGESRPSVHAAVNALVAAGLAQRDGERIRASAAAWRFDALWPIRL
jgi:hypothetical protein